MIVEAKREIPWTKPEDIPYPEDRSQAPPKLGGWFKEGFLAVMGDGSVHLFKSTISKTTLQHLIERNDGHVIRSEDLGEQPRRTSTKRPPTVIFAFV